MEKKNQTPASISSKSSRVLDKFFEACLNIDSTIPEESKDVSSDSHIPAQIFSKDIAKEPPKPETEKPPGWKKAEEILKAAFQDIHSRVSEINKGLHDNSKISELIVELVTVEMVRKILAGKVRDLKGNEAMINIHPRAAKMYWDKLKPGSVLVLKSVTVFSPSAHTHCLIVLKDNILHIFSP